MNPLQEYPQVRQWAYRVIWVLGFVLGAVQVYLLTVGTESPPWLLGAVAVLGYVSIATNYTADRNVTPKVDPAARNDVGLFRRDEVGAFYDGNVLITIAAIVVILCGLVWLIGNL